MGLLRNRAGKPARICDTCILLAARVSRPQQRSDAKDDPQWECSRTGQAGTLLNSEFRRNPGRLVGKVRVIAIAQLLSIVAGLGVFIGVVEGTGLGPNIGSDLALLIEESLLAALALTMFESLVLSMGMPTLPAYATVITIVGIFLSQRAGDATPLMAVHLFVLYFSVLSPVTPPVALAAYAAAPIAGAHPFETGITAVLLCAVAFVVPFALLLPSAASARADGVRCSRFPCRCRKARALRLAADDRHVRLGSTGSASLVQIAACGGRGRTACRRHGVLDGCARCRHCAHRFRHA